MARSYFDPGLREYLGERREISGSSLGCGIVGATVGAPLAYVFGSYLAKGSNNPPTTGGIAASSVMVAMSVVVFVAAFGEPHAVWKTKAAN